MDDGSTSSIFLPLSAPAHLVGEASDHTGNRKKPLFPFDSIEDGHSRARDAIFGGRVEIGKGLRKVTRQVLTNAQKDTWHFSLALVFAFCHLVCSGATSGNFIGVYCNWVKSFIGTSGLWFVAC